VSEEIADERATSHLQYGFSEENHFLPGFFYDKVLYLVPVIVRSASSEVHFVNRVLFVTRCSSRRFVGYIGDEIIYSRRMIRRRVQI
jgi:hypothetical protein